MGNLSYTPPSGACGITMYTVNRLVSYTATPSLQHMGALKCILQYLAGTKSLGITYRKNQHTRNNLFHGYSDASYASMDDSKLISGYVFISGGGAITWCSRKQSTIALSSTEVEYVAISEVGREACWLRNLYKELGEGQNSPSIIKGDNEGPIAMMCGRLAEVF